MDRSVTLALPGVDIHTRVQGETPRAVFVHGFGSSLHTWDVLWQAMDGKLPALRYDLRGFGSSHSEDDRPFSHAGDLLAVLDAMGLEQCDLVGVSMGGAAALHVALNQPQRVGRLVLISPALMGWEWSADWRQRWRAIVDVARAGEMDAARELWWQHPLFDTTRASAAGPLLRREIMAFAGNQWIHNHEKPVLPDVERLCQLTVPTLLLTGGRDLVDFRLIADLIEGSAASVQRIDEPALGHLLHLEDAERCAQRILAFLVDDVGLSNLKA